MAVCSILIAVCSVLNRGVQCTVLFRVKTAVTRHGLIKLVIWKKLPPVLQQNHLLLFDISPIYATLHRLFISGKLLHMFWVVSSPIIRSTHKCIYSICYLLHRYCYLPLLWMIWNWFEYDVGIVLICFGAVATAPKQVNKIPTSHSNQFQIIHNSGRWQ